MQEPKLGAFLAEEMEGLKVTHIGGSAEILRGVRFHFAKLVKGLTNEASSKAQLGLGHSYSRAKVKFNVHKSDNMIIQVNQGASGLQLKGSFHSFNSCHIHKYIF